MIYILLKMILAASLVYRCIGMMIIAFITMKSGVVPLIEGLCAQILYFRFEIIGGLRHLLLFVVERKNMP